jgi:hypothetical protein
MDWLKVDSFERPKFNGEALRFSENFTHAPSSESPEKFQAPPCFLVGDLETNWNDEHVKHWEKHMLHKENKDWECSAQIVRIFFINPRPACCETEKGGEGERDTDRKVKGCHHA